MSCFFCAVFIMTGSSAFDSFLSARTHFCIVLSLLLELLLGLPQSSMALTFRAVQRLCKLRQSLAQPFQRFCVCCEVLRKVRHACSCALKPWGTTNSQPKATHTCTHATHATRSFNNVELVRIRVDWPPIEELDTPATVRHMSVDNDPSQCLNKFGYVIAHLK